MFSMTRPIFPSKTFTIVGDSHRTSSPTSFCTVRGKGGWRVRANVRAHGILSTFHRRPHPHSRWNRERLSNSPTSFRTVRSIGRRQDLPIHVPSYTLRTPLLKNTFTRWGKSEVERSVPNKVGRDSFIF